MRYIDLHVHTSRSDGAASPEEMVCRAAQAGVGVLAIADHDVMEGSREAEPFCRAAGITLIPAVEVCVMMEAISATLHVLAYWADFANADFAAMVHDNRARLNGMSDELIRVLSREDPRVSEEDYRLFPDEHPQGGWKALYYLMARGVCATFREGMFLYAKKGVSYEDAGFASMERALGVIHRAGGLAVLAHPPSAFRPFGAMEDLQTLEKYTNQALEYDFDGIESVYAQHTPEQKSLLKAIARKRDLIETAGSDDHAGFSGRPVGSMQATAEQLNGFDRLLNWQKNK